MPIVSPLRLVKMPSRSGTPTDVASKPRRRGPYQLFMLGLSVYVLAALAVQAIFELTPDTLRILDVADTLVCVFFLGDFFRSVAIAPNRRRYLLTWGWLDLLSSIPAIDLFRWGRAARVFLATEEEQTDREIEGLRGELDELRRRVNEIDAGSS